MDSPTAFNTHAILTVRRIFSAPIDRVFAAWTNAEVLASWFGPVGFSVASATIDLRVGGKYQIVIKPPDGETIKHFGEYVEIIPPERLAFTWMLENQACKGSANQCAETLVSIDFKCIDQSTQIVLTHERLPDKAAYDGHEFGWNSSLDSFEKFILTNK